VTKEWSFVDKTHYLAKGGIPCQQRFNNLKKLGKLRGCGETAVLLFSYVDEIIKQLIAPCSLDQNY
jgi:hypothetical protein